jgi:hypothetical protein
MSSILSERLRMMRPDDEPASSEAESAWIGPMGAGATADAPA